MAEQEKDEPEDVKAARMMCRHWDEEARHCKEMGRCAAQCVGQIWGLSVYTWSCIEAEAETEEEIWLRQMLDLQYPKRDK